MIPTTVKGRLQDAYEDYKEARNITDQEKARHYLLGILGALYDTGEITYEEKEQAYMRIYQEK